eukprot:TRINITY_DN1856_c0_g1_i2.p2 TRINITY_DN1856_c0_g1~~TRINITY_DN1856_c0_g1_i2.p2  ORF type:complete len:245 (-),score=74.95 TRINITY_DN1856_c0_g1_i2:379-1113(-)
MTGIKAALYQTYVKTAGGLMPTLGASKFVEEGVLTPDEFVLAGDLLVAKCKTWSWEAGDPSKAVAFLPKDKQFLMTRNVKCAARVATMEALAASQKTETVMVDDEEWVAPVDASAQDEGEIEDISKKDTPAAVSADDDGDDDEDDDDSDVPEMSEFVAEDNLVKSDPATMKEEDHIEKTRTYDISITYDNYFRTPKVWLFGYDEKHNPLTPAAIFEDISADHANKTVTIDNHPHLGIPHAFVRH